jgi:hypothetical protein
MTSTRPVPAEWRAPRRPSSTAAASTAPTTSTPSPRRSRRQRLSRSSTCRIVPVRSTIIRLTPRFCLLGALSGRSAGQPCNGHFTGGNGWPEHLHVVPGGDGIQQLRCGIFGRFGRLPAVHRARPPSPIRRSTSRHALCNHAECGSQCALLVPMDTTTMIGATDDQSHRHKV